MVGEGGGINRSACEQIELNVRGANFSGRLGGGGMPVNVSQLNTRRANFSGGGGHTDKLPSSEKLLTISRLSINAFKELRKIAHYF